MLTLEICINMYNDINKGQVYRLSYKSFVAILIIRKSS